MTIRSTKKRNGAPAEEEEPEATPEEAPAAEPIVFRWPAKVEADDAADAVVIDVDDGRW